jgi:hypothetical protein
MVMVLMFPFKAYVYPAPFVETVFKLIKVELVSMKFVESFEMLESESEKSKLFIIWF